MRWSPPSTPTKKIELPASFVKRGAAERDARVANLARKRPVTLEHVQSLLTENNVDQPDLATWLQSRKS